MIRRPPRSTLDRSSAASDVYKRQFVVQATGHHPMETRTAMAYWQNGKLYIHCSTQSVAQTVPGVARWCGIEPTQVVLISEYTGLSLIHISEPRDRQKNRMP